MGWAVLYIAFGIVALWLLGEVLLQYKARLRWRLVAFAGFSTVVVGVVALSSVVVIALGAAAFAVGQTFVTLSYRRGFSTGWALGGMPGSSRRRRGGDRPQEGLEGQDADPVLEVSGIEEHDPYGPPGHDAYGAPAQDAYEPAQDPYEPPTCEPQPLPDETGEYGVYDRADPSSYAPAASHQEQAGDPYGSGYGTGYGQQEQQHQYAPYSDPYTGYDSGQYAATAYRDTYGGADAGYGGQTGGYPAGGYDTGYDPYGGAWVPQQRDAAPQTDGYGEGEYVDQAYGTGYGYDYPYAEAGQPAEGYGNGHGAGYDPHAQGYGPGGGGYGYDEQRGY